MDWGIMIVKQVLVQKTNANIKRPYTPNKTLLLPQQEWKIFTSENKYKQL